MRNTNVRNAGVANVVKSGCEIGEREYAPDARANRAREEGICARRRSQSGARRGNMRPTLEPIGREEREYAPDAGANRARGEGICARRRSQSDARRGNTLTIT
eukprot:38694-Prorocentrum_minimum.AAC.2